MKITDFIPQYSRLNGIYKEIQDKQGINFQQQKFITNYYAQNKDVHEFEASVIKLMFEVDSEHYSVLLNSLKQEIEKNISIYTDNKLFFDNIDTERICRLYGNHCQCSIKNQTTITQEHYKDLMEVNGSLDSIGFRAHTQQEEDLLHKKYDRYNEEYKREEAKLRELYDIQRKAQLEAAKCTDSRFKDIAELGSNILSIIEKYTTSQKKKEKTGSEASNNKANATLPTYFTMKLVSAIHEICNSQQFENISELDFYANLNLQPCENKLKIRPREKARVCYLLFLMSEKLTKQDRENWKEAVMDLLEIDREYYKSKYKDPVSDFPSDNNQKFANEMKAIFK